MFFLITTYTNIFLQKVRTILETKYHCCKSYKLKSLFANLRLFYYPAQMHVKILAPEFGAAGYKDLDSSSSLYAEIPQEMI